MLDVINTEISVIMPVWNTKAEWLSEAIDSILNQTYQHFEFIIVNDCSTNQDTLNCLNNYRSHHKIKIIDLLENKGVIIARNIAIKMSKCEYIAIMDSDDISHPLRLEKQINFLINNPAIDIVGINIQGINEQSQQINFKKNFLKLVNKEIWSNSTDINRDFFTTFPLMKKSILINVNCYDENLINYNFKSKQIFPEDLDLYLRLLHKNYTFANLQEYLLFYRMKKSGQGYEQSIYPNMWNIICNKIDDYLKIFKEEIKISYKS